MKWEHLLAKTTDDPKNPKHEETLLGHTEAVIQAVSAFNDVMGNSIVPVIGDGFNQELWQDALFCSAWLHDLGKSNDHFQKTIRRIQPQQGIRHETLGFVVAAEFLSPYLEHIRQQRNYPEWFRHAILFAISGHHRKFPDKQDRKGTEVQFFGEHRDIDKLMNIGKSYFGLNQIPKLRNQVYSLLTFGGIGERISKLKRELDSDFSPKEKRFIAVLKSMLICADIAGSALPEKVKAKDQNIRKWLKKRIMPVLQKAQLEDVVQKKLKGFKPKPFQEEVMTPDCNTVLIEAGCGAGKTAAAYLWASQYADGKRLFFCYPTTATAAEGFAGYLRDPDFEAILVNSRADVDYRLLKNLPGRSESQIEFRDMQLEALETWTIPAVVCTAHTVLGLLQNCRKGIIALPSMVRSAFVFDEVHSYSPKLFAHFLRFLEIFSQVPVLMMTATLPPSRKKALDDVCKKRGGLRVVQGHIERENAPRYLLHRSDEITAWDNACEVLKNNGKVLWVCNTVCRAMKIVQDAIDKNLPVEPFHSRYRYKDRLIRQRKVVDGFESDQPAMLAVTTQVAEMSLDLSADLLVSEYAPIASMIQRLGRLNRFEDKPSQEKSALFIKPEDALPYAKKNEEPAFWEKIESWLNLVADGKPKSQKELAEAFVSVEEKEAVTDDILLCDWIDDPMTSLKDRKSLMEPGYTIDVVRQEDIEGRLDEMVMPMPFPKGNVWHSWIRKGRYLIAPVGTIEYSDFEGGKYAKNFYEAWIM